MSTRMQAETLPLPEVPAIAFRTAMRRCANTVAVIALGEPEDRAGITVTSFATLSDDPPSLMIGVGRQRRCHARLKLRTHFTLSLLAVGQEEISNTFAGRYGLAADERFNSAAWTRGLYGPVLVDALAVLECVVAKRVRTLTHSVLLAHVQRVRIGPRRAPLLYANGSYTSV